MQETLRLLICIHHTTFLRDVTTVEMVSMTPLPESSLPTLVDSSGMQVSQLEMIPSHTTDDWPIEDLAPDLGS